MKLLEAELRETELLRVKWFKRYKNKRAEVAKLEAENEKLREALAIDWEVIVDDLHYYQDTKQYAIRCWKKQATALDTEAISVASNDETREGRNSGIIVAQHPNMC